MNLHNAVLKNKPIKTKNLRNVSSLKSYNVFSSKTITTDLAQTAQTLDVQKHMLHVRSAIKSRLCSSASA
jgi:hypothetical protein